MNLESRREFVSASVALAAASTVGGAVESARAMIGIIGVGGMGMNHLNALLNRKDVEVAYVCDVDQKRLDDAMSTASKHSAKPAAVRDLRQVLDDKRVEAVLIATPD